MNIMPITREHIENTKSHAQIRRLERTLTAKVTKLEALRDAEGDPDGTIADKIAQLEELLELGREIMS